MDNISIALHLINYFYERMNENELYWPIMIYEEFVIVTEAPQCNRMTATGPDTEYRILYKQAMYKIA